MEDIFKEVKSKSQTPQSGKKGLLQIIHNLSGLLPMFLGKSFRVLSSYTQVFDLFGVFFFLILENMCLKEYEKETGRMEGKKERKEGWEREKESQ